MSKKQKPPTDLISDAIAEIRREEEKAEARARKEMGGEWHEWGIERKQERREKKQERQKEKILLP